MRSTIPRLILRKRLGYEPDVACHTCDNRWCCNPDHIRNGTAADNARDREMHGKSSVGSGNGCAKLSEMQVKEIRQSGLRYLELATLYAVDKSTIGLIKRGKTWRHV